MPRNRKRNEEKYITRLARDLKAFREKEASGQPISQRERRNIRARERRVMKKMRETAKPLIEQANQTLENLIVNDVMTLSMKRAMDELAENNRTRFDISHAKRYEDLVQEITSASAFLNAPDTNVLTGTRQERNIELRKKYASQLESLQTGEYVKSGLIPTEEDAKKIFRSYRKIEEYWAGRIGKQGQNGVYGSENLVLYMIDVYNKGLDAESYGFKALEDFNLELTPEFQELVQARNKVTGISGLFQEGGYYEKLKGLI